MLGFAYLVSLSAFLPYATASAPSGPWDNFNYAPASRTVHPAGIHSSNGDVKNPNGILSSDDGPATLSGTDAWVTVDFGKEVGGVVSLTLDSALDENTSLALTFAESPSLIDPKLSDDWVYPVAGMTSDGAQPITGPLDQGLWSHWPISWQRGGFRYLTVSLTAGDSVALSNVSVALTFSPNADVLRDYKGYFYTKDTVEEDQELLTKIWYAGAYTIQTNIIAADQGRGKVANDALGWNNSGQIAQVGPVIVDAARRDR